jgi:hypothetical protein
MKAWIGLGLAVAALAAGTARGETAPQRTLPILELGDCHRDDLPKTARCGVFHVAENPSRRPVRVLDLKVAVLPARSAHPLEPIFVFPGGPGGSATDDAVGMAQWWMTDEHPVVLMDPRGSDPQAGRSSSTRA